MIFELAVGWNVVESRLSNILSSIVLVISIKLQVIFFVVNVPSYRLTGIIYLRTRAAGAAIPRSLLSLSTQ